MGRTPPQGAAHAVLTGAPLLGRKKELADLRRLLLDDGPVTVTGPAGVGKTRLIEAALEEDPAARGRLRESAEALGDPGERVLRLRPLAEAPAVELLRELSGDESTPYAELAAEARKAGNLPGAIAALAMRQLPRR